MEQIFRNVDVTQQFLMEHADAFSSELAGNIRNEKVSVKDDTIHLRVDVSGKSNVVPLLTSNTKELPGISSFAGATLPSNKGFICTGMGLFYGTGDADKLGDCAYSTGLIAQLLNSELVIKQKGSEKIKRLGSDLTSKGAAIDPSKQVLNFNFPVIFRDLQDWDMSLIIPNGSAIPAAAGDPLVSHLIMLKFWGYTTQLR